MPPEASDRAPEVSVTDDLPRGGGQSRWAATGTGSTEVRRSSPQKAGPDDLLTGAAGHPWYTALGSCPDG